MWRRRETYKRWKQHVGHHRQHLRKGTRKGTRKTAKKHPKNMCRIRGFCGPTKDIPRKLMPQIKHPLVFAKKIKEQGVTSARVCIKPSQLRPSQNEINQDRVMEIVDELQKGIQKPTMIVISKDNYIVDGHHRWAAYKVFAPETCIRALRIDLPAFDALGLAAALESKREAF